MRRIAGILCAAAVSLPVPFLAEPADAAVRGGVSCAPSLEGTEVWSPPLPKRRSALKAKPTITITNAKFTGCTSRGGAIKRGTLNAKIKWLDAGNCDTLSTYTPGVPFPRIKGSVTIAWNTGKTSTAAVTIARNKPYVQPVQGRITDGKFAGSKLSVWLLIKPPKGACDTKPLTTVPFAALTKLTIT
jgi:hypothetical protein